MFAKAIIAVLACVCLAEAGGPEKFWVNTAMGGSWDKSKLTTETSGEHPSLDFRVYYNYDGKRISPWHDIPLKAPTRADEPNGLFHFHEIPDCSSPCQNLFFELGLTPGRK